MTSFNGFQSPNFTQIPNEYLDYTFSPECNLTKVQMQIMNFVFRETFGWQDKHKILVFSVTDIMALLNIKKRNTIVDALNNLVEDKKFLESIEVAKLSKKVRANVEKSLGRKLQPKQKIYRLNLVEGKKRPWDNVEEPHTDLHGRKASFKGSNQMVTTSDNHLVTTSDNQMVTTSELESLETLGASNSLNKGLNKDLNKREEEEASPSHSDLIHFLLSKDITLENANKFETRLLKEGLSEFTYDQVLHAIEWSLYQFINGKCDEPYIYAVGRLQRLLDGKVKEVSNKPKRKPRRSKPIRTEILPEWFDEDKRVIDKPKKETKEEIEQEQQKIKELLKKMRAKN